MTVVEQILWRALRGKQLDGHRFRRQHPIGHYIVDFACIEQQLVVELDGGQHQEQIIYDEHRTCFLLAQGWRVLRFWTNEVICNLEGVLSNIVVHFKEDPHPSLPPVRGKE
jgi:very-short-patch-repair endonuclease